MTAASPHTYALYLAIAVISGNGAVRAAESYRRRSIPMSTLARITPIKPKSPNIAAQALPFQFSSILAPKASPTRHDRA